MESNDLNAFKNDMDVTVQKSKLRLIKKRVSLATTSAGAVTSSRQATPEDSGGGGGAGALCEPKNSSSQLRQRQQITALPDSPHIRQNTSDRAPPAPPPPVQPPNACSTSVKTGSSRENTSIKKTTCEEISRTPTGSTKDGPVDTTSAASAASASASANASAARASAASATPRTDLTAPHPHPHMSSGTSPPLRCCVQWICQDCSPPHACIPVRGESRCLCGHRYKEHKLQQAKTSKTAPGEAPPPAMMRLL